MSTETRIPIPMDQKWRRFRYSILPTLCFFGCVVLVLVLWEYQAGSPNAVGEVELLATTIPAKSKALTIANIRL